MQNLFLDVGWVASVVLHSETPQEIRHDDDYLIYWVTFIDVVLK